MSKTLNTTIPKPYKSLILQPDQWVNRYSFYLHNFALNRVNNEEVANDLVQDTFLAALENIEQFKGRSSEKTWLTAILKYKIFEFYQWKAVNLKCVDDLKAKCLIKETGRPFLTYDSYSLEKVGNHNPYHWKELYCFLDYCLMKLPPLWSSVFRMKYLEEMESTAICQMLKISASNYWVCVHRARMVLRSFWDDLV